MQNKKIFVENLCLELTRKCNLNCAHCMRGCQNQEMSDEVIERIFEDIDGACMLEFTGAEPTLAVNRIKKVIQVLQKKRPEIHRVAVMTNGVNVTDEFVDCLLWLQKYCAQFHNNPNTILQESEEDFTTGLVKGASEKGFPLVVMVTLDKYHLQSIDRKSSRQIVKANIQKLEKLFPIYIENICDYMLHDEGRAKKLQGMYKVAPLLHEYVILNADKYCFVGPMVNISCFGSLVETYKTYEYEDANAVGDITKESFLDMVEKLQYTSPVIYCKDINKYYKQSDKIVSKMSNVNINDIIDYDIKHNIVADYTNLDPNHLPNYDILDEEPIVKNAMQPKQKAP